MFVIMLEAISWAVLAVFCLSIFINKMIGVELVQNMQLIYYVHLIHSKYSSFFSVFGFLSNSSFNFLFKYNFGSDIYSKFQNIEFNQENHQLSQFIIYGIYSLTLIFLIFHIFLWIS